MEQPTQDLCPSCGAPIDLSGGPKTCQYCGAHVEPPHRHDPHPPPPMPQFRHDGTAWTPEQMTAVSMAGANAAKSMQRGCLIGIFGLVALIVAGVAVPVFLATTGSKSTTGSNSVSDIIKKATAGIPGLSKEQAAQTPVLVPSAGGAPSDVAVVVRTPTGSTMGSVALLDGATGKQRWKLDGVTVDGNNPYLAGDAGAVYVADGTRLLAVDRTSGATKWTAALATAPPAGCDSCVLPVGTTITVLERDGTLQGFSAPTGGQLWSKRLDDTPRDLYLFGGKPGVSSTPKGKTTSLIAFDPTSGAQAAIVSPVCTNFSRASLNFADGVVPLANGTTLTIMAHGCAILYDANLKQVAAFVPKESDPFPDTFLDQTGGVKTSGTHVLVGDQEGHLFVFDATSGLTEKTISGDDKAKLSPVAYVNGVAIVLSLPTFDQTAGQVIAYDTASGASKWQVAAPKKFGNEQSIVALASGVLVTDCLDGTGSKGSSCTEKVLDITDAHQISTATTPGIFAAAFFKDVQDPSTYAYVVGTSLIDLDSTGKIRWTFGS